MWTTIYRRENSVGHLIFGGEDLRKGRQDQLNLSILAATPVPITVARAPTSVACDDDGQENNGPDKTKRCGLNWGDANATCGALCATDEECDGETCYADLDITPCAP